jgi:hypothetical protein
LLHFPKHFKAWQRSCMTGTSGSSAAAASLSHGRLQCCMQVLLAKVLWCDRLSVKLALLTLLLLLLVPLFDIVMGLL